VNALHTTMSSPTDSARVPISRARSALFYVSMLAIGAVIAWLVRERGLKLSPPTTEIATPPGGGAHSALLLHVLLCLAAVTLFARFVGGVFRRYLKQPPVMGEILAGILLGPSLLGVVWPDAQAFLLPASVAPYLGILAKVGVVLFMFLVGLELDPKLLRGNTHAVAMISHSGIVTPFVLGIALSLWVYSSHAPAGVSFEVFALFFGTSLSVTAFPVLARILIDRKVQNTRLGSVAMACAAIDDATAWVILAIVAGIATSHGGEGLSTFAYLIGYAAAMWFVVRPLLARFVARHDACSGPLTHTTQAIVMTALLLSAAATEAIGIHALFGAFALGALMPHDGRMAEGIRTRLEDVVIVLFLPIFFVFTGMRTSIGLLSTAEDWYLCGLIILVATLGKFGGTFLAARFAGLAPRRSAALGILMNTRGLMELIVLNLGLDLGVLTPTLFAMLVLMALVTTFATTPILDLLLGKRGFDDGEPQ